MFTALLQVVLTAAAASYVSGSAITLTSSASSIKPLVSSNLTVTCALLDTTPAGPAVGKRAVSWSDDVTSALNEHGENADINPADDEDTVTQTSDNVQFVTSMVISRDGVDLATISEHSPVRQLVPGFTVSGHLTSGAGERGRLTLTWPHPTQADAGTYSCDVTSLNSQVHTVVFHESVKVAEEEVTINDLVAKLHTIELEKEKMQNEMDEMKKAENKLKNEMHLEIDSLNVSLVSLKAVARVEPKVFFSAILASTKTLSPDNLVVYDKIITNEGAAYNNGSGKFTCPVGGFYHFELNAFSVNGNDAYLGLRYNGNLVVTVSNVGQNNRASSNTVTLKLTKGDVVDVAAVYTSNLYYDKSVYLENTFSGHLMALA